MIIYHYVYFKIYQLMLKVRSRHSPSENAVYIISIVTFLYTSPLIAVIAIRIFTNLVDWLFLIISLTWLLTNVAFNYFYFEKTKRYLHLIEYFGNRLEKRKTLKDSLVIVFVLGSLPASLIILKYFDKMV